MKRKQLLVVSALCAGLVALSIDAGGDDKSVPVDENGQTPLHILLKTYYEENLDCKTVILRVNYALSRGVSWDQPDKDGNTPLDLAFTACVVFREHIQRVFYYHARKLVKGEGERRDEGHRMLIQFEQRKLRDDLETVERRARRKLQQEIGYAEVRRRQCAAAEGEEERKADGSRCIVS